MTGPTPQPTPGPGAPRGRRDDLLLSHEQPAPRAPEPAAAPAELPAADGRFQLLGELGRGGMGVVYRARELASGREVALKVLKEALSPQRLLRFRREGELTARLSHPGIVRVHSMGTLGGKPCLAYELVEGATTLGEAFRTHDELERVRLVRDAAEALAYAHAAGVTHRDVKPDNVLLDRAGRVHVADFGLAAAQDVERLTTTGVMVGTPSFMPPEQLTAQHERVGPHSDVWALGVMLYLALTGEHPFPSETLYQLIDLVSTRDPAPPRSLNPAIPPALEAVCLMALARDPAARYPDAGAMVQDLDLALAGARPSAEGPGWRRALPAPRRLLLGLSLTAALVLLAAALLAGLRSPGVRLEWEGELPAAWGGERPLALAGRVRGAPAGTTVAVGTATTALDREGRFALWLDLPGGKQTLEVRVAREGAELARAAHVVEVDRAPPRLEWPAALEPRPGEQGRVSGIVRDEAPWVELLVAGQVAARVAPGVFSFERPLRLGPNPLQVSARDAWGNLSPPEERVLWRVPDWWAGLPPEPERPPFPLPPGVTFGEGPGEYVNARDGSLLVWVAPPPRVETEGQRLLRDGDVIHRVEEGLFVGRHEVTWGQWERFCQASGRVSRRPAFPVTSSHPVHHVSWDDATAYCAWAGLRLPTEVEWEMAGRGPHGPGFPWGEAGEDPADWARRGNFLDPPEHPDGWEYTAPVGSFPAGHAPTGCLDMAGNVFEWVQDWYGPSPVTEAPLVGWAGPPSGEKRVLKGGGFDLGVKFCNVGRRFAEAPERALPHTGFRVARAAR